MAVIARVAAKMRGNTEQAPASGTKSPKYGSSIAMKVVSPQYSLHMPNPHHIHSYSLWGAWVPSGVNTLCAW